MGSGGAEGSLAPAGVASKPGTCLCRTRPFRRHQEEPGLLAMWLFARPI